MSGATTSSRVRVFHRHGETVTPLELFFDLLFVLAITQCTALMANHPTWAGIGRGLLVLGLLWWSWVGFAWLTSVVHPDEGLVRLVLFAAMAALLVTSLCVPHAFSDRGLVFALAYGAVRVSHIALFVLASRDDEGLRHSVVGLAVSTAIGITVLTVGALVEGSARPAIWSAALVLDMGGPLVIDVSGWRLVPGHFAERHGLIIIVALGESIVAIGVGAQVGVDAGVILGSVLGMAAACALWWVYFDSSAVLAAQRLAEIEPVAARNRLARDAFSYLHLVMVAAIVLGALGLKSTLARVGEPLRPETAAALVGGAALYLLGHVAFKYRTFAVLTLHRLMAAIALLAFLPFAHRVDALVTVGITATILVAMVVFEVVRHGAVRARARTH